MKILTISILFMFLTFKVYGHGTIIIQGVKHEKGKIDVKIYLDKETFLKEELAVESIRKKPTKGETIIPLTKVNELLVSSFPELNFPISALAAPKKWVGF